MTARATRRLTQNAARALGAAVLLVWSLGPICWALVASITPPYALVSSGLHLWPAAPTWEHYAKLFGATSTSQGNQVASVWPQFSRALVNSVVTSGAATVLTVAIAALGAWASVRLKFPARDVIFIAVVAPLAVPGFTVLLPLYRLMIAAGLIDTYSGVTLIYVSAFLPLALWLMRSVYRAMPLSPEEAAWIDGGGKFYTMVHIVLPLAGAGGLCAADVPVGLGAVHDPAGVLTLAGDQALDRADPGVCHPQLCRLRVDERRRHRRHHSADPPRPVSQPVSGARPDGRCRQITLQGKTLP